MPLSEATLAELTCYALAGQWTWSVDDVRGWLLNALMLGFLTEG